MLCGRRCLQSKCLTHGDVPVDFERFLSQDDGQVDIYLGTAGTPTVGRMTRSANQNATPRVYGNKPLREFFQSNFKRGDSVLIEFVSPRSMRIGAQQLSG